MSTSNQPSALRRDKIALGHSNLQVSGKILSQELESQKSSLASLGQSANKTQITNITTGVTCDGRHGVITTVASTLAANAEAAFVLTNKYLATSSVVLLNVVYNGSTVGKPVAHVKSLANGSCSLVLNNVGTAALDAVVVIHYLILGVAP